MKTLHSIWKFVIGVVIFLPLLAYILLSYLYALVVGYMIGDDVDKLVEEQLSYRDHLISIGKFIRFISFRPRDEELVAKAVVSQVMDFARIMNYTAKSAKFARFLDGSEFRK